MVSSITNYDRSKKSTLMERSLAITLLICGIGSCIADFKDDYNLNLRHKQVVVSDSSIARFVHNTHGDNNNENSPFFKLLDQNDNSVAIGGRNVFYNFSFPNIEVVEKIEWNSPKGVVDDCMMKGKRKFECANFIRSVFKERAGRLIICGTYAYGPKCRRFDALEDVRKPREIRNDFDGIAIVPFSPTDNTSAIYDSETSSIFAATVSDFDGTDPLIYKKNFNFDGSLRTPKDDAKILDGAQIVNSFEYGDYVYFFYREFAVEAQDNNNEKQIYSRVGRVCKQDKGGTGAYKEKWTTYTKARLNCSLPGDTPFYFNELQSVTSPKFNSEHGGDIIYAAFSTSFTSITMSAVCGFSMKAIVDVFDHSYFKYQPTTEGAWIPYYKMNKNYRPGQCDQDLSKLADINFVIRNPLLYDAVKPIYNKPIFAHGPDKFIITSVAVASQTRTLNVGKRDVLFLGTSDGKVMKVLDGGADRKQHSVYIQSQKVHSLHEPIISLAVVNSSLMVLSQNMIVSLPLQNCNQAKNCVDCVRLQDPHCAWDTDADSCIHLLREGNDKNVVQSVSTGFSEVCPNNILYKEELYIISDNGEKTPEEYIMKGYQVSTFVLAVIITFIVAVIFGIALGYRFSQRQSHTTFHNNASSSSSSGGGSSSDYESYGRAKLTRNDSLTASKMDHIYSCGPGNKGVDAVSLMLSMNHHQAQNVPMLGTYTQVQSGSATPRIEKNAVNCTLPRDYKVKKVYL